MTDRKSYGQFCALARALDHVGDRWTLLVVRELLGGEQTFRSLQTSLAGVSPNLLLDRLGRLVADGLVERSDAPARSKHVTYALTPTGSSLEPVVFELIRWGSRYMAAGPGNDCVDPAWTLLALRALLEGPSPAGRPDTRLHLDVSGFAITISDDGRWRRVESGHTGQAQARLDTSMPEIVALASGYRDAGDIAHRVVGDVDVFHAAIAATLVDRGAGA